MGSWKELMVWQRSHEMVLDVYSLVKDFPKQETYSLVDQLKRAAYSVQANIVEGYIYEGSNSCWWIWNKA